MSSILSEETSVKRLQNFRDHLLLTISTEATVGQEGMPDPKHLQATRRKVAQLE